MKAPEQPRSPGPAPTPPEENFEFRNYSKPSEEPEQLSDEKSPPKPNFEYQNPTDEQIARKSVIKCSNLLHDAGAVVETLDMEGRDERGKFLNGKRISIARQRIKQARKALDRLAVDLNRRGAA
jgi:hypothetical protein